MTAGTLTSNIPLQNNGTEVSIVEEKLREPEYVIKQHFKDVSTIIPVMIEIAKCESNLEQFDRNGNVVKNPKSSAMGVFQIMSSIHRDDANKLGYDIDTLEGNVAFARHLYNKFGTKPWEADPASKRCWSNTSAYSSYLAMK